MQKKKKKKKNRNAKNSHWGDMTHTRTHLHSVSDFIQFDIIKLKQVSYSSFKFASVLLLKKNVLSI